VFVPCGSATWVPVFEGTPIDEDLRLLPTTV